MPKDIKKKKTRQRKKKQLITIDVTDLSSEMKIPKNMEVWSKENPMSKKCNLKINELASITCYLAKQLNSAPELKTNFAKRAIVLKSLVSVLMLNTFLDNFHRYGILYECMNEAFQRQHPPIAMLVPKTLNGKSKKPENGRRSAYVA